MHFTLEASPADWLLKTKTNQKKHKQLATKGKYERPNKEKERQKGDQTP
jgi:hypothetical protein